MIFHHYLVDLMIVQNLMLFKKIEQTNSLVALHIHLFYYKQTITDT